MYHVAAKNGDFRRARVLDSQEVRTRESRLAVWVFAAIVLFAAIVCVWSRAKVITLGYEISRESRHLADLKEVNENLRAEVAMLRAPGRLEPIARQRLNLAPPKSHQIVLLK